MYQEEGGEKMSKNKKRKMIREGKEESIIERLEEYILPVYPEWRERRVPASEEKIAEWKERCGNLLPEAYLQYLKYMGEGDGEFLSRALLAKTKLSEMIEWYEKKELNPRRIKFAILDIGCGEGWYITTKENKKQVIETDFESFSSEEEEGSDLEDEYVEYAESFEKLLCQKAYFRYESKDYRYTNYISIPDEKSEELIRRLEKEGKEIFEEIERESKRYGFEKAWYSDRNHYIGIKENMSFYIARRNGIDIGGAIQGENLEEVEEMSRRFREFLEE